MRNDISKCIRSGMLKSVGPLWQMPGQNGDSTPIPFIPITLESEFYSGIGDDYIKECTNVLLVGQRVVDYWNAIRPTPQEGDDVRLTCSLCYCSEKGFSSRVFNPDEIEVIPKARAETSSRVTVNALDYFRQVFQERNQEKGEK